MVPTNFRGLAEQMAHLWAKSGGSPLLDHLCDVCWQAHQFLAIYRPAWPLDNGVSLNRIVAYASLVHDFGKVHPEFQSALKGGKPFRNRHEILSLAFLGWLEIPPEEEGWLAAAIATHHRSWCDLRDRFVDPASDHTDLGRLCRGVPESDALLVHELLNRAAELIAELGWTSLEGYPVRPYAPLNYGEGVLDAIGKMSSLFAKLRAAKPARPGDPANRDWKRIVAALCVRGTLLSADHLASLHPWPVRTTLQSRSEVARCYPNFIWEPHQEAVAEYEGNALLIAPTGSGKTEAALLWAARQAEGGKRGRLSILLPYQASLNAMQRRLLHRLTPDLAGSPERWNESVGLLHGRALRHFYESFLAHDYAPATAESHAREQNAVARHFVAPISLATVYSVIRLLFATRGPERLWLAYTGARVVVDEVHAYAPEVTALSLAALGFLAKHLDARVLFMSATVPSHLEAALSQTMEVRRVPERPPFGKTPRHRLKLLPFECLSEKAIGYLCDAARRGSVLVVVNQVKRAKKLWEHLRERVPCRLLHSRFHYADRAAIEGALKPETGVLVATQTVEVSLDLDFDTCFSELAPIESIAQRFGRCNRRGCARQPAPVHVFLAFPEGRYPHHPYQEGHLEEVRQALAAFCRGGSRDLGDSDVHDLLNDSYPEQLKYQLRQQLSEKTARLRKAFLDQWQPFGLNSGAERRTLEAQWEDLFDGEEVLPKELVAKAESEGSLLGAFRYLVPMSGRQFRQFYSEMDWNDKLKCYVISRPYGEGGLDLWT